MCGIGGIVLFDESLQARKPLERFLDSLLVNLENRGKDATGFLALSTKKARIYKRPVKATDFIKVRPGLPDKPSVILAHTRLATMGEPAKMYNNHPVQYESCYVTHNGMVTNYASVFSKIGLDPKTEVDSEILAALLHKYGLQNLDEFIADLGDLYGSIAAAAVDLRNPNSILLMKTFGSPLFVVEEEKFVAWASTPHALKTALKELFGPKSGKFKPQEVVSGRLLVIDREKREINSHNVDIKEPLPIYRPVKYTVPVYAASSPHPLVQNEEIRSLVKQRRAKGMGRARIRPPILLHSDQYALCTCCFKYVHKKDLDGSWCTDCDNALRDLISEKIESFVDRHNLTDYQHALHDWAEVYEIVHEEVMRQMASEMGIEEQTLEYLLFHVDIAQVYEIEGLATWRSSILGDYRQRVRKMYRDWGLGSPDKGFKESFMGEKVVEVVDESEEVSHISYMGKEEDDDAGKA